MREFPVGVLAFLLCAFTIATVSCTYWRYEECRKVGHGTLYCLWVISSKGAR